MNKKSSIFITARFRTGSTLIWNIFHRMNNFVSYYEPLHEHLDAMVRDFCPIQDRHYHVDDYFSEYRERKDVLTNHRGEFGFLRLVLDSVDSHASLQKYIDMLISSVESDKTPVLQFNRVDFRLPWLKYNYPNALLVHQWRSPRDQWVSMIDYKWSDDVDSLDCDAYRITTWSRDMCVSFPFLADKYIRHPYQRHYYLWKLSYLAGTRLADVSFSYSDLLKAPMDILDDILTRSGRGNDRGELGPLLDEIVVQRPHDVWKNFKSDGWFLSLEKECEDVLDLLGLNKYFGLKSLADIMKSSPEYHAMIDGSQVLEWLSGNAQRTLLSQENMLENKENALKQLVDESQRRGELIDTLTSESEERLRVSEERGRLIDRLTAEAAERGRLIDSLTAEAAERARLINRLTVAAEERGRLIERLTAESEERLAIITRLNEDYRRDVERLNAELAVRDQIIAKHERFLAALKRFNVMELARMVLEPRLGVLYQHPPAPLVIPERYGRPPAPKMPPRFSIVTPVLNQAAFVERTILSVLGQGYPELEYVVRDGGSADGAQDILRRYEDRLSWVSERDGGQTQALNLGFVGTGGEIMAYLNADDVYLPGTLYYVAAYFERHPKVDVVYGHRLVINEQDHEVGRWVMPPHDDAVLSWADYLPQETMFWRRRIWDKAGGSFDESFQFAMDWDLVLRFREAGARMVRLPRFLGAFRVHPQQKTSAAIADLGEREMARLRQRCLGRVPDQLEIWKNVRPYILRHIALDRLHGFGLLKY